LKKFVPPLFLVVCTQLTTATLRAQSVSPHPNIVAILADDLGYGDTFDGCPDYSTPNIDQRGFDEFFGFLNSFRHWHKLY